MDYGERMKDIRNDRGVLQKNIAKLLDISLYTYSHYETEDTIIPIKHLIKFCDYFQVSVDYILGLTDNKTYDAQYKEFDLIKSGERLKNLRKDFKITQKKLATDLNTVHQVVSKYEKGINMIATPFLYTICKKYHISADYLLGRIDMPVDMPIPIGV